MKRAAAADRGQTRDAILDAVGRLLARYGYSKMTIDDVAREAGIGKGTVYLYFESKQDLALSRIDRIMDEIHARLQEIAASNAAPAEKVRSILHERVLMRFDAARHYSESIDDVLAAIRAALHERREDHFRTETAILAVVLRDGRRKGAFALRKAEETAAALIVATNALLPGSLSARQMGSRDAIEEKIERVADLLLRGLLART